MQYVSRLLGRWYIALGCVFALAAAILLPGLDGFGLWEPHERQLADRAAPRAELAKKQTAAEKPVVPPPPVIPAQAPATSGTAGGVPSLPVAAPPPPPPPPTPPIDSCLHQAPKDAIARTLTTRAAAWGRDHFDDSDSGRRMPFALLGLLTVLATAGIAMRGAGARAGIVTALVLLAMPLLVLQSRQLTSEIGTAAAGTLIIYGLMAIGRLRDVIAAVIRVFAARTPFQLGDFLIACVDTIVGALALGLGVVIGFVSGGALLGLLVPIGAFAAAGGLGVPVVVDAVRAVRNGGLRLARRVAPKLAGDREPWAYKAEGYGAALVATIVMIGLIGLLAYQLYDLREPQPGAIPVQRALFGKAIVPNGCWSSALGGIWRADDDLRYVYDSTFEQIAYGTFPWGILAPIAIASLIASADRKRRQLGAITLAWAGAAWIASEMFQRKVGFSLWAGFPALAVAIGVWLDGMFTGRARGDREATPAGAALIGLFVAFGILDLGKDMQTFSERITSILIGSDGIPYPTMSKLIWLPTKLWILIIGMFIGLGFAITMLTWRDEAIPPMGGDHGLKKVIRDVVGTTLTIVTLPIGLPVRLFRRWDAPRAHKLRASAQVGAAAALGFTLVMSLYWSFVWQPMLATHLSSKAMFDMYLDLRKPGDALVIMGDLGDAPYDYAPDGKPEIVTTREQIVAALGRPTRVFAIAPQTERCQLHREIGGKPYYVIDDRNQRSWLLSNKVDGTTDKNPLAATIVHSEPKNIPIRPKGRIVFDQRIELLGWDIPKSVDRGSKFEVKMFYKVLQPVGGAWTVLFHFDGSLRFNGDHPPIDGLCQTSTWQKDDYIIDTHTVLAGGGAFAQGKYDVWTGFFTGSNPNWKNMPVSEAPGDMRDTVDRVKITTITLE